MTIAARPDEVRKSARRSTGTEPPVPSAEQVARLGQQVLERVLHAKDRDGDALAEPFMRLPSRRQYPEYYVVIKRPLTLSDVRTRLKQQEYATFADVKHDFELICNNAKRFNERDSDIWLQARDLHVRERLTQAVIKEASTDVYDAWLAGESKKRSAPDDGADAKRRRLAESVAKSSVPREERETPKPHKITLRRSDAKDKPKADAKPTEIPKPDAKGAKADTPKSAPKADAAKSAKADTPKAAPKPETPKAASKLETPKAAPKPETPKAASKPETPKSDAPRTEAKDAAPAPAAAAVPPVARVVTPYASPVVPRPITTPYITEPRRRGAPRGKRLKVMLRWAVQSMTSLQDDDGRAYAEMFLELPSRQDYPDYYQFIQHPISFAEIDRKLDQKEYINPHALVSDLYRMLSNAQFYNEEHSQVSDDAQALRTHLEKTVIPAFLAEGFTLDPNDHRQAALPPGTPGAVPPPSSSPSRESPPRSSASPAPASARPIVRVAPVGAAPGAAPAAAPPPVVRPASAAAPVPAPAPAPMPTLTLEQVVRAVEARTWPAHPAVLETPAAAAAAPAAPAAPAARDAPRACPVTAVRVQLYADAEATEALAEVRLALDAAVGAPALRVPRRTASAMVRLELPERPAVRVALDRREVGGAWIDAEAPTYAFHTVLAGGTHTLEARDASVDGAAPFLCIYMHK